MELTTAQRDRACGVLLATAAGDALGAGYEFGPPIPADVEVSMRGGGAFRWAKGEWTDDTSMAIAIAEVAARGLDLRTDEAQDEIVARWYEWSRMASDVGNQTRHVLGEAGRDPRGASAASAREASADLHEDTGHTAGNGSLMRTAPVALAYLDDEDGLVEASRAIGALTHFDPEAGEACLLWCLAIRHAVLTGELDVRIGLRHLYPARATVWVERFDYAEHHSPADFTHNGWAVEALQGAWSAIAATPLPGNRPTERTYLADHLRLALESAVRGGRDADTVAAIAGGLLGAAYGASAVPAAWRRTLHGWPGLRSRDLVALANAIVERGRPDRFDNTYTEYGDLSALARHPYDDQVWLGAVGALTALPASVDAVVSLCRIGDVPDGVEVVEVRLIDKADPVENPNLGFVLDDAVAAIEAFRAEGRSVLVHCVQAHSRTPTIGALYAVRALGIAADEALREVCAALPAARPIEPFRTAVRAAGAAEGSSQ
jgi:ADP-ribosyl-[dinitrogen reductase] hydrolase